MLVVLKIGSFIVPFCSFDYFDALAEKLRVATGGLVFADF